MIAKKRYRRDKLPATSLNRKRIFISYRFGVAYPVYSGSDLVWHIRYTAEVMNGYKSGRGGKSILRYQR
jgi:hypothetical protein